ncbi:MAG: hypothetical protein ACXV5T_09870, partial [Halobacteriota archaeon]
KLGIYLWLYTKNTVSRSKCDALAKGCVAARKCTKNWVIVASLNDENIDILVQRGLVGVGN